MGREVGATNWDTEKFCDSISHLLVMEEMVASGFGHPHATPPGAQSLEMGRTPLLAHGNDLISPGWREDIRNVRPELPGRLAGRGAQHRPLSFPDGILGTTWHSGWSTRRRLRQPSMPAMPPCLLLKSPKGEGSSSPRKPRWLRRTMH